MAADRSCGGRPLRAAVVGCGRMGVADSSRFAGKVHPSLLPVGHAEALAASEDYELVGFCDLDRGKAMAAAARYGAGRGFGDLSEMLEACRPEVVTVATRTEVRPGLVSRLAAEGTVRGIYAEKPFSRSVGECDTCLEAVAGGRVRLVLGTPRRYLEVYREAFRLVCSGGMGRLRSIHIHLAPGALLLWSVPHFVDLLILFAASTEVSTVEAECDFGGARVSAGEVDCDPVVQRAEVVFANGVFGKMVESDRFRVDLACEEGVVEIEESDPHGPLLRLSPRGGGVVERRVVGARSGISQSLHELARALAGGEANLVSPREIALQQRILSAIACSALGGGGKVALQEVPADLTITGRFGTQYA